MSAKARPLKHPRTRRSVNAVRRTPTSSTSRPPRNFSILVISVTVQSTVAWFPPATTRRFRRSSPSQLPGLLNLVHATTAVASLRRIATIPQHRPHIVLLLLRKSGPCDTARLLTLNLVHRHRLDTPLFRADPTADWRRGYNSTRALKILGDRLTVGGAALGSVGIRRRSPIGSAATLRAPPSFP